MHRSRPNHSSRRCLALSVRYHRPDARFLFPKRPDCVLLSGEDRAGINRFVRPPRAAPR
jgi:hypothetical protein